MKINTSQMNKELRAGVIKKIQKILTPEEFAQVKFEPVGIKYSAPKEIFEKIAAELKDGI